jgi:hypothetical protein
MDDRTTRFHNYATVLFVVLAAIYVVATIVVLLVPDAPVLARIGAIVSIALVILALVALVRALDHDRAWAVPATIVACWFFIVAGVVQVLYDLTQGTFTIPLVVIGAVVVLLVDPRPSAERRIPISRPLVATTLCLVLGFVAPAAVAGLSRTAPFAASPDDLAVAAMLTCEPGTEGTSSSAGLLVDWQWDRGEPFPTSYDAIVIRWRTDDEFGDFFLVEQPIVDETQGLWIGSASPTSERAQEIEAEGPAVTVGIDLALQQYRDGHVEVRLSRDPVTGPQGTLVVDVVYLHLDRWEKEADQVACEW